MGCNCKVNKQILNIHNKFGFNTNASWGLKAKFHLEESIKTFLLLLLILIFSPFILIWFLGTIGREKKVINVNKIMKKFVR